MFLQNQPGPSVALCLCVSSSLLLLCRAGTFALRSSDPSFHLLSGFPQIHCNASAPLLTVLRWISKRMSDFAGERERWICSQPKTVSRAANKGSTSHNSEELQLFRTRSCIVTIGLLSPPQEPFSAAPDACGRQWQWTSLLFILFYTERVPNAGARSRKPRVSCSLIAGHSEVRYLISLVTLVLLASASVAGSLPLGSVPEGQCLVGLQHFTGSISC